MSAEKTRKALRILDFRHKKAAFKRLDCISYGAKAGLEFSFNSLKINGLREVILGICPQNGT